MNKYKNMAQLLADTFPDMKIRSSILGYQKSTSPGQSSSSLT